VSSGDCFKFIKNPKKTCAILIETQSRKIMYKILITYCNIIYFLLYQTENAKTMLLSSDMEIQVSRIHLIANLVFRILVSLVESLEEARSYAR